MVYLTFSFRKFVNIKNDEKYVVLNYMTEKNNNADIIIRSTDQLYKEKQRW